MTSDFGGLQGETGRGLCSQMQLSRHFLLPHQTWSLIPASGRATWDQTHSKPDSERPRVKGLKSEDF